MAPIGRVAHASITSRAAGVGEHAAAITAVSRNTPARIEPMCRLGFISVALQPNAHVIPALAWFAITVRIHEHVGDGERVGAAAPAPSYRQLASIPGFTRLVASMLLARIAQQMVSLVLVLLALERFRSPEIAGLVTFLTIAPGLVVSPLAGALLDRQGRTRLVILDYAVAAISLGAIAALAVANALSVPILLVIVAVSSLTGPLSNSGIRTLFPVLVPRQLWERANAIDSNGYVVASIVGPAAAGALVATVGSAGALAATAAVFAVAVLVTIGLRDPGEPSPGGNLLADAWRGVVYVAHNDTLRALAFAISTSNIAWGLTFLALPVLVLESLRQGPDVVGILFALVGVAGSLSVLAFGRISSVGREGPLMAAAMVGQG
ncbi:MAG: MFS transporter, partial [Chloroflexi bacterium]